MKSQKGISLISLTIYVIATAIIIGILATVTTFFYKNVKDTNADIDPITEYTTFNSHFSEEINHPNIKVVTCKTPSGEDTDKTSYIVFSNNVQYTYIPENKGIYKDNVKICRNIENCTFEEKIENGKSIITVNMKSGDKERRTEYVIQK